MEGKPAWASQYSLKPRGTYYEGFVEDVDSLLAKFQAETVTTFGIRRSRYTDSDSSDRVREPSENKENEKVNILLLLLKCNRHNIHNNYCDCH